MALRRRQQPERKLDLHSAGEVVIPLAPALFPEKAVFDKAWKLPVNEQVNRRGECPSFGPKRTYPCAVQESAFDPKRTLTTKFYRGALRGREGFRSFRPNGTSDKICTVKRCGFKRMPCSVATSFLFSPARWSPTPAMRSLRAHLRFTVSVRSFRVRR